MKKKTKSVNIFFVLFNTATTMETTKLWDLFKHNPTVNRGIALFAFGFTVLVIYNIFIGALQNTMAPLNQNYNMDVELHGMVKTNSDQRTYVHVTRVVEHKITRQGIKQNAIAAEFTIDESMVRTFYYDDVPVMLPPGARVTLFAHPMFTNARSLLKNIKGIHYYLMPVEKSSAKAALWITFAVHVGWICCAILLLLAWADNLIVTEKKTNSKKNKLKE